jgi:hypothetical protein
MIVMPTIDLLLKIQAILSIFALPFDCKSKNKDTYRVQFQGWMEKWFYNLFALNSFEIVTLEKQKKYT